MPIRNKLSLLKNGCKKDPNDERDYKFSSFVSDKPELKLGAVLPNVVSWRDQMSPVKFQGNLGACVAFAVCALKEWQEQEEHKKEVKEGKKYNAGITAYNLSEQWVYWNAKKIDPWPGEEGTNFRSALKVLNKIGVPVENAWEYSDNKIDIGKPESWAHMTARWASIGSYWRINESVSDLKTALVEGPVLIGMVCFKELHGNLVKGVIPLPSNPNDVWGYHAILCVGYDDDKQQVCIKNSWSPFWGERGYGYLSYEYVEKYCWDFWVAKDISVTSEMLKGKVSLTD